MNRAREPKTKSRKGFPGVVGEAKRAKWGAHLARQRTKEENSARIKSDVEGVANPTSTPMQRSLSLLN
jgi:hypothetical protein